jgi:hypothetical protein
LGGGIDNRAGLVEMLVVGLAVLVVVIAVVVGWVLSVWLVVVV